MSLRSWYLAAPRKILICQIAGFCIFVIAFFLPACQIGKNGTFATDLLGWECAKVAYWSMAETFLKTDQDTQLLPFLSAISGLINPLILLYVSFSFSSKFFRVRTVVAFMILVCMAATWILFAVDHFVPLIGHFLWIFGALLILAPEILLFKQKSSTENQSLPPSI